MANWKKQARNLTLINKEEGFYISYMGSTSVARLSSPELDALSNLGEALGGHETGEQETALYTTTEPHWRILNGDYRKEYEAAFPLGKEACIAVYELYKNNRSGWSTDDE